VLGTSDAVSPQVLYEREEPLAALHAGLVAARGGSGRMVLVAGDAGVGKTALVHAFAAQTGRTRLLLGACDPLSTPAPLGPFRDIAAASGEAFRAAVAGPALPQEVFAALRDALEAAPAVVVVEDAHWADEASLDVLRLLGRRLATLPVLVVVTFREAPAGAVDALRLALGDLAGAPGVARLVVEPLSPAAVAALAAGTDLDPAQLHRRTAGNPFYVTEAIAAGSGALPATVRDAVLARVARLGADVRGVLDVVASSPPAAESWLLDAVCPGHDDAVATAVAAGLLDDAGTAVAFRHEIAREAVESSIPPAGARRVHARLLAALVAAPQAVDPARLAHHAEAARDADAAVRHAGEAAARATAAGAHREAAAQYGRALRFAGGLPAGRRAALLEARAEALYAADDQIASIADLHAAIALHRELRDVGGEAEATRRLVPRLLCRGPLDEARAAGERAVALLAAAPARRELGGALAGLAHVRLLEDDFDGAIELGRRAAALAAEFDDAEATVDATITAGMAELLRDGQVRVATLERGLALARERGVEAEVPRALDGLAYAALANRALSAAERWADEGLAYAEGNDLDLWRLSLLAARVWIELYRGRWRAATEVADLLTADLRDSPAPRAEAQLVRALVRARRGDPGAAAALAEAAAIEQTDSTWPLRLAAAQAEIDWLGGRADRIGASTEHAVGAAQRTLAWPRGELALWRHRAGCAVPRGRLPEPVALELRGRAGEAAAAWERLGCPYEAAVALSFADDAGALSEAHDRLHAMGARPAAAIAARRLRERGVRGIARGPRPSTSRNPANLTKRELDVLMLVADGLANAEIAARLFVSTRTVDHHVSAILRKLDAPSRTRAVAKAAAAGIVAPRA
jgi:DNA-binding CsgD family transcriptional regulator